MTENELNRISILTQLAHQGGTGLGSESISLGGHICLKAAKTNLLMSLNALEVELYTCGHSLCQLTCCLDFTRAESFVGEVIIA